MEDGEGGVVAEGRTIFVRVQAKAVIIVSGWKGLNRAHERLFVLREGISLLRVVGDAIASTVNLVYKGSGPSFFARNLDLIRENKGFSLCEETPMDFEGFLALSIEST